jgi:hypothetical protein
MRNSGEVTEAINRCEVTIHLLQKGYMIFHPEADVDGIDFVLRNPQGKYLPCQLKSRCIVQKDKYGGKGIWMVFPGKGKSLQRDWYLIEHDRLFSLQKKKHGTAPNWRHKTMGEYWSEPVGDSLAKQLSKYLIYSVVPLTDRPKKKGKKR